MRETDLWYDGLNRGGEEVLRRWIVPIFEVRGELQSRHMAGNTGHGHRAGAPGTTKVVVKLIVLDEPVARIVLDPC